MLPSVNLQMAVVALIFQTTLVSCLSFTLSIHKRQNVQVDRQELKPKCAWVLVGTFIGATVSVKVLRSPAQRRGATPGFEFH